MKKNKLVLLLLLAASLVACDEDDDVVPDMVSPEVEILSSTDNATFLVIEMIEGKVKVVDNNAIKGYRVFLVYPDGSSKLVKEHDEFYIKITSRDYPISIKLPKGATMGEYILVVEAEDRAQNVAKDSLAVTIHAPDISSAEFARAFNNVANLTAFDAMYWDWMGYDLQYGIVFEEYGFESGFFDMVDIDYDRAISGAEWEKFIADFNLDSKSWASLDEDNNGTLDSVEFGDGFRNLISFEGWDLDKDGWVNKDEFANGIFGHWDTNKDNLLSKEEYLERFFTYLSR
ncbi:hypothetical protein [Pontibacter anaerobius]|uniref:EF-hand domain-containing protein n=1 Tax=Pontibacter anaerobius TaxID=2993940 RepID=A0ABT3RH48_9BACT|nr:hypothetical protein [Pontibacter anaerobius]MCX2740880.1 hypothetical protein [Pontibacter anaerobius]